MAKRILVVLTERTLGDGVSAAAEAARLARETGGLVRLMYIRLLPPARVDRYDRVVADADREMARIAAAADERMARIAADLYGVPVERVVRFGRLGEEVVNEAAAIGADLVALASPARPSLVDRARAWYVASVALGSSVPVLLWPARRERRAGRREVVAVGARL